MVMHLEGSCHCQKVKFTVDSEGPYPFMCCCCMLCRKTTGSGGYGINIIGDTDSLKILQGKEYMKYYLPEGGDNKRYFCSECGTMLYFHSHKWPQWVYPVASAIDTQLPTPPSHAFVMEEFKAPWAYIPQNSNDQHFDQYPDEGIIDWHKRHGLLMPKDQKQQDQTKSSHK